MFRRDVFIVICTIILVDGCREKFTERVEAYCLNILNVKLSCAAPRKFLAIIVKFDKTSLFLSLSR